MAAQCWFLVDFLHFKNVLAKTKELNIYAVIIYFILIALQNIIGSYKFYASHKAIEKFVKS